MSDKNNEKKPKKKKQKGKKSEYLSNSPYLSHSSYDNAVNAVTQMVKKKNVYNIGIIAPYGAGKSSLIATYKDSNKKKLFFWRKKITQISLLNLCENNSSDYDKTEIKRSEGEEKQETSKTNGSRNTTKRDMNSLLEKSILEQLFFKEKKATLPFSKIERIYNRFWPALFISLLVVALIASIVLTITEYQKSTVFFPDSHGKFFFHFLFAGVGLFFVLLLVIFTFVRIGKLKYKNIEVAFNEIKEGSVLNLFLDEIVYYFKKTRINVVIFEDIDRFETVRLFTKLREINHVLNNNKRIRRKITFIYCVSDNFFQNYNDRAKFFDFVLSLVPVLGHKSVGDPINSCIKKNELKLDSVFSKKMSRFISDKRVLNNIINDYTYFKLEISDDKIDNKKLFAMMVYKNLYFKDYVELQNNRGLLFELFGDYKQKRIAAINANNKEELRDIEKELEEFSKSKFIAKNFRDLKAMVTGIVISTGTSSTSPTSGYNDITSLNSFENVSTGLYVQTNVIIRSPYYNQNMSGTTYKNLDLASINNQLGKPLQELEKSISESYTKELVAKRLSIKQRILEANSLKLKEIFTKYGIDTDTSEKIKETPFVLFSIMNGYIDESYYLYIGHHNSGADEAFIINVVSGVDTDPLQELEEPKFVIIQIDVSEFGNKSVLNYSLIEALFSSSENEEKQERVLSYLSLNESDRRSFVYGYYVRNNRFDNFMISICKRNNSIVKELFENEKITKEEKLAIISDLVKNRKEINIADLNQDNVIGSAIEENRYSIDELLPLFKNVDDFLAFLSEMSVKALKYLTYSDTESNVWKQALLSITKNFLFEINSRNLKEIGKICMSCDEINVSSFISDECPFKDYMRNNIDEVVNVVSNESVTLHEKEDVVFTILTHEAVSYASKKNFIRALAERVEYRDEYSEDVCTLLLEFNKIKSDWNDVTKAYVKANKDSINMCDIVVKNQGTMNGSIDSKELLLAIVSSIHDREDKKELIESMYNQINVKCEVDDIKDDLITSLFLKKLIIDPSVENFKKCSSRPLSIIEMLIIDEELVRYMGELNLNKKILIEILESKDIDENLKLSIMRYNEKIVVDNFDDDNFRNLLLEIIANTRNIGLSGLATYKLVKKMKTIESIIASQIEEIALNKLPDVDLLKYIELCDGKIYRRLTETASDDVFLDTNDFDRNVYIGVLIKRKLLVKSGNRNKIHTKVNVKKIHNLLNPSDKND